MNNLLHDTCNLNKGIRIKEDVLRYLLSETKQNPCLPFRSLFATPHVATSRTR